MRAERGALIHQEKDRPESLTAKWARVLLSARNPPNQNTRVPPAESDARPLELIGRDSARHCWIDSRTARTMRASTGQRPLSVAGAV